MNADHRTNETLITRGRAAVLGNYRPLPIVIEKGDGAHLEDVEGKQYIDLVSGIAVSSLGYNHKGLISAIQNQSAKLLHASNIFWNEPSVGLAESLVEKSFADKVFFCNSGAEANEAMLKLARRYFFEQGDGRFEFIAMDMGFHGRTMGTITCGGQAKYRLGFEPLLPGVRHVPFGDLRAIEAAITERTAGILLEPIQGEGGIRLPPPGFFDGVRELCEKYGCLMLLDEVQSGVGRTGSLFAYEAEGVAPDIMTLAKGLGGGLPIGAMLTTDKIGSKLPYGSHGSTFGGNPVACAAAQVVMDTVSEPVFLSRVAELGNHMLGRLKDMASLYKRICVGARGRGLWAGLELSIDAAPVPRAALQKGLVVNVIGGKTIRLAPPLVISMDDLNEGLDRLQNLLAEFERG
jgi:acetylornithine/N-succinyldiaminopimelate aminotransferase